MMVLFVVLDDVCICVCVEVECVMNCVLYGSCYVLVVGFV